MVKPKATGIRGHIERKKETNAYRNRWEHLKKEESLIILQYILNMYDRVG
jgi:hypothetical protein